MDKRWQKTETNQCTAAESPVPPVKGNNTVEGKAAAKTLFCTMTGDSPMQSNKAVFCMQENLGNKEGVVREETGRDQRG